MTRIAAAYLRRSSADLEENQGLDSEGRQLAAVQRMCGPDVAVYRDWNMSGRRADRPDYQRLRADIAAGLIGSVCAESLSRLGRSTSELLDFADLCKAHDVTLQTDKEKVDTSGAMGTFLFTVMAAFGQLEAEVGRERILGANASRELRHREATGEKAPPKRAVYGTEHVTNPVTRITTVVVDQEKVDAIVSCYRDAGTIRGACQLAEERGIPAPYGGKTWATLTLTNVIRYHAPELLPVPDAKGARRHVNARVAVFAGLLRCHCGARLTPKEGRGYYCKPGQTSGSTLHGKMYIGKKAARAMLEPEAARYSPQWHFGAPQAVSDAREALERTRERWLIAFTGGAVAADRFKKETEAVERQLADLGERERDISVLGKMSREPIPSWDDPVAMNAHVRRLWSDVYLNGDMKLDRIDWNVHPTLHGETEEPAVPEDYEGDHDSR